MQTFVLSFPSDTKADSVKSSLGALGGVLRSPSIFAPSATIAFEVVGSDAGIVHRLKVASSHAEAVLRQLRTLVPGIRVEPGVGEPAPRWDCVAEIGMTSPTRSLRAVKAETLSASLLAAIMTPGENQAAAVMMQLVVSPIGPIKPPREKPLRTGNRRFDRLLSLMTASQSTLDDQRAKIAEPNFTAVLRIAGKSNVAGGAEQLVARVQQVLGCLDASHNRLKRRRLSAEEMRRRLSEAAGYPATMQLSLSDLTAMIAWPIGNPQVVGLPAGQSRHLPATGAIARTGRVICDSNYPGAGHRPLALSPEDATRHVQVIGGTGVGKSTLCAGMAAQDLQAGHGLILIEAKRDLFEAVINLAPEHRLDDMIIFDVMADSDMPLGFNPLIDGNPRASVERLCGLFERLYHDTRGVWTRELLYMGLSTLVTDPKYTFVDLAPLLIPMTPEESDWRDELIRSITDPELQNFWRRFQSQPKSMQERIAQPVMDRIWTLNARPEIRNIIGQSVSSFDMEEVVREGRVLLVNLAGLPEATASLIGTLILNSVWAAVQASAQKGRLKRPLYLYLDEFQSFLNFPISPEEWFAKARSFGCGVVASHQHLGQLSHELKSAMAANCKSKVAFQLSSDDAMMFAREFGRSVSPDDFNLGPYEVICRLATGPTVSQPVTGITRPPAESTGLPNRHVEECGIRVNLVSFDNVRLIPTLL